VRQWVKVPRKRRSAVPLGDELSLFDIKDAGHMRAKTLDVSPEHIIDSRSRFLR